MQRLLMAGILGLTVGHALGVAQGRSPYQQFGDFRSLVCASWMPSARLQSHGRGRELWLRHAPEHAWAYGFIAGAGYMPPVFDRATERLMQIDIRGIDARLDEYCAAHPGETLQRALTTLVEELAAMR